MTADPREAAIIAAAQAAYGAQRDAMVAGDADALGDLLTEDFTLTHIGGLRQTRVAWLTDVRSGAMTYHSIRDVDITVALAGFAGEAVLTARTRTDATIRGRRGTWPLQLKIDLRCVDDRWLAAQALASTW